MLRKLSFIWFHHVYPQLASLIATVGIVGLSACLLIIFILSKLFSEVLEREAFSFDTNFLLWVHQFANPNLDAVMLAITWLGNPSFVIIVVIVSFFVLWLRGDRQEAKIFLIACLGAAILNTGLKLFFTKQRPQLWKGLITETSFSFPSGHALGSLVLYGLIAYFLATKYPKYSQLIYSLTVILIGAIGLSRLYLGVHWFTDVIAGYGVGFLWLIICISMLKLQKMHRPSIR
ncbi:MAG: phosphatase PAP2 family protein [Tatlockia sp.]|nr:phosphatase PAP2 family protein [Tatlockia sp.]